MTIRYGSVCSGIEAATVAWKPLGWEAAWFSEIEGFPKAVLAHHYPDVPDLGDMTDPDFIDRCRSFGPVDVIVGGTPCQSWSVAGERKGFDDPRGRLTFTFVNLVDQLRPSAVVWENVPGILSASKGKPFEQFLDAFCDMGYQIDADILDAQDFGVAQRRRRVFLVCLRADILMKSKTDTSRNTLAKILGQILLSRLEGLTTGAEKGRAKWVSLCAGATDGLKRKMMCYGRHPEELWGMWLGNLADSHQQCQTGAASSGSTTHGRGGGTAAVSERPDPDMKLSGSEGQKESATRGFYWLTEPLWRNRLEGLLSMGRSSTTSTGTNPTTQEEIFTCSETLLNIARRMCHWSACCPTYSSAASSVSTVIEGYTKYARSTDGQVLVGRWLDDYGIDFIEEAEGLREALSSLAAEGEREIPFEFEGGRRDTAPGREARQGTPRAAEIGAGTGGPKTFDMRGNGDGETVNALVGDHAKRPTDYTPAVTESVLPFDTTQVTSKYNYSHPKEGDPCHPLAAGAHPPAVAVGSETGAQAVDVRHCSTGDISQTMQTGGASPSENTIPHVMEPKAADMRNCTVGDTAQTFQKGGEGVSYTVDAAATQGVAFGADLSQKAEGVGFKEEQAPCVAPGTHPGHGAHAVYPIDMRNVSRDPEKKDAVNRQGVGVGENGDPAPTMSCAYANAVEFSSKDDGRDVSEEVSPTIRAGTHDGSHANGGAPPAVTFQACGDRADPGVSVSEERAYTIPANPMSDRGQAVAFKSSHYTRNKDGAPSEVCPPLTKEADRGDQDPLVLAGGTPSSQVTYQVRRLTPIECEKLQGFPDEYTRIPWRKKGPEDCPDGLRYKALGNSFAVPVVRWIGRRIGEQLKGASA